MFTISITTKMKRRTFISTAILGVLNTNQLLASTPIEATKSNVQKWFSVLLEATDAKQRKRYLLVDKQLKSVYETTKHEWSLSGYQALEDEYFMCRDGELALFPIELKHDNLGQIDFAVLVFEKTEKNGWQESRSLSGFHIEALTKSLGSLPVRNINEVADYIFPTGGIAGINENGYTTKKGSVSFYVEIIENKAIINAQILVNNEIVWNTKCESLHTLS